MFSCVFFPLSLWFQCFLFLWLMCFFQRLVSPHGVALIILKSFVKLCLFPFYHTHLINKSLTHFVKEKKDPSVPWSAFGPHYVESDPNTVISNLQQMENEHSWPFYLQEKMERKRDNIWMSQNQQMQCFKLWNQWIQFTPLQHVNMIPVLSWFSIMQRINKNISCTWIKDSYGSLINSETSKKTHIY